MGKHDKTGHLLHISKEARFKQNKPALSNDPKLKTAPQQPHVGTNSLNHYR